MPHHYYCTTNCGGWQDMKGEKMNNFTKSPDLKKSVNYGTIELPRMRTIDEAYAEIKSLDNHTAITKNFIRTLIVSGKVPSIKAGRKYLVNIETLLSYLYEGEYKTETLCIGKVRPISDTINRKWGVK